MPLEGIFMRTWKMSIVVRFISYSVLFLLMPAQQGLAQSTHSFNSGMNCNGVWNLPDTGQTLCYDDSGGSIVCPAPGAALAQDGTYSPAATQPRYTIVGATTLDTVTGLIWITDANQINSGNSSSWANALSLCKSSTVGGYLDWRLPNVRELMSILDYGVTTAPRLNTTAFTNTVTNAYITSTTYVVDPNYRWIVNFNRGEVDITNGAGYVRCVRGGP